MVGRRSAHLGPMHQRRANELQQLANRSEVAAWELAQNADDLESQGYNEAAATLRHQARACRVNAICSRTLAGGLIYMSLARS